MNAQLDNLLGERKQQLLPCVRIALANNYRKKDIEAYWICRLIINGLIGFYNEQEIARIVMAWRQLYHPVADRYMNRFASWIQEYILKYTEKPLECGAYIAAGSCKMSKCEYWDASTPRKSSSRTPTVDRLVNRETVHREPTVQARPTTRPKRFIFPCVRQLMLTYEWDSYGEKSAAAYAIVSNMLNSGWSESEIGIEISSWNTIGGPILTTRNLANIIARAKERPSGCTFNQRYGFCTPNRCRIANRQIER